MTVREDCENAHSRNSRFLLGSNSLAGREPFAPVHVLSSSLVYLHRPEPPNSPPLCSHCSNLSSDLSGESNKNCLLRRVNESNRVLDVCSLGPANSLRLQTSGSDDGRRSQIPLISSTMAENAATPFPSSVGETHPDLSEH